MTPISLLIGPAAALNIWLVLHIWFGGWFFFRFCQGLGASARGSFLGGFAYMCSPFVAVHLPGHYTLVQIGFTSGALFSLSELARRSATAKTINWRAWLPPALGLGTCVMAVAATDFYLAMMTILLLLPAAAAHMFLQHGRALVFSGSFWKGFAIAIILATVGLLPWIYAVVTARHGHNYQALAPGDTSYLVARWSRLVSLPQYHPVWRPLVYVGDPNAISVFNEYTYLGAVSLLIAAIGALIQREHLRFLIWVIAFLLALGLSGANSYTSQPAWPGTLLAFGKHWPTQFPFAEFRVPGRWQFALCAVLAVGVALGSDSLFHRLRRFNRTALLTLLLFLLAFDLMRFPVPLTPAQPLLSGIKPSKNAAPGTVLDIPVGVISGQGHRLGTYHRETLRRQMNHGRPIISAYVARLPTDVITKRQNDPELTALLKIQDSEEGATIPENLDWTGFQRRYNISVVRIPLDWPTSTALQALSNKMNPAWQWTNFSDEIIGR